MKLVLYRFNASIKKLDLDVITSIDAGNGTLTVTTISGTAYIGYHIKLEH